MDSPSCQYCSSPQLASTLRRILWRTKAVTLLQKFSHYISSPNSKKNIVPRSAAVCWIGPRLLPPSILRMFIFRCGRQLQSRELTARLASGWWLGAWGYSSIPLPRLQVPMLPIRFPLRTPCQTAGENGCFLTSLVLGCSQRLHLGGHVVPRS
jgi:hypothetical protein